MYFFFQMCVVAVILFLVAWMPFTIYFLIISIKEASTLPALFHVVPAVFAKTSTCYNPVIYAIVNKRFRIAIQRTILCEKNVNDLDCIPMHAKGAMKANIIQKQEHAKAYFVSHCWTHAQWWICFLLSIPFHFVSMKRKPIWVSKPHYCIQWYILGGTASLISFVLPFSDNHFSNKKIYCSHSQIFRGFLHFLEIYPEIPNMFNVNFMKWRYIMRYLSITVERFTGVDNMPLV